MTDAEKLEEIKRRTREALKSGLDAVNVHPKDEAPSSSAPDRVRAFHRALGLPEDPKFWSEDQ